jgi:uncharacterized alkaline shock family protein YloU
MAEATATKQAVDRLEGLVLETKKGITTVADAVVAKIAGIATREVTGVYDMGKTFRRLLGRVTPGETITQGVAVEVGRKETAIDMVIVIEYGHSIPELAEQVRENVIARVESGTGLIVKEVNIEVDDLYIPSEGEPPTESRVE